MIGQKYVNFKEGKSSYVLVRMNPGLFYDEATLWSTNC